MKYEQLRPSDFSNFVLKVKKCVKCIFFKID